MNKKSSISVTLLVIGVFALCAFALFTFFASDYKSSNSFVVIDHIKNMSYQAEEFLYYLNQDVDENKALSYFPTISKPDTRYLLEESFEETRIEPGFNLRWKSKVLLFEIKYYFN